MSRKTKIVMSCDVFCRVYVSTLSLSGCHDPGSFDRFKAVGLHTYTRSLIWKGSTRHIGIIATRS